MTRRQREQERHQQEIMEAAREVFLMKDYEGATMQDIAARAEFSLATVYKHVDSKEQLFQMLIAEHIETYLEQLNAARDGVSSPIGQLRASVRVSLRYLEQKQELTRLMLQHLRGLWSPDVAPQTAHLAYRAVLSDYEKLFEDARDAGELADVEPTEAALCLLGTLYLNIVYWLFVDPDRIPDADAILRTVLGPMELSDR